MINLVYNIFIWLVQKYSYIVLLNHAMNTSKPLALGLTALASSADEAEVFVWSECQLAIVVIMICVMWFVIACGKVSVSVIPPGFLRLTFCTHALTYVIVLCEHIHRFFSKVTLSAPQNYPNAKNPLFCLVFFIFYFWGLQTIHFGCLTIFFF